MPRIFAYYRPRDHPCHSCCFNIVDRKLVSSWYNLDSLVTSSYVQPPERRPGNAILASGKLVPVIDLGVHDRAVTIKNILNSSQDYVFFQVQIVDLLLFPYDLVNFFFLLVRPSSHVFVVTWWVLVFTNVFVL